MESTTEKPKTADLKPGAMPEFDLAVIGAGAAGLSVTAVAAQRGLNVVLIERDRSMEEAAASLGARQVTVLRRIVLPALTPAIVSGVALLKKQQGTPLEKTALDDTTIDSDGGTLKVDYSSSDSQFASLLPSPLFQSVVK